MRIVDRDQAKMSEAMSIHRERGFAPDLTHETMTLPVTAGALDLGRKAPCPDSRRAR
jgi:hypothetical protein